MDRKRIRSGHLRETGSPKTIDRFSILLLLYIYIYIYMILYYSLLLTDRCLMRHLAVEYQHWALTNYVPLSANWYRIPRLENHTDCIPNVLFIFLQVATQRSKINSNCSPHPCYANVSIYTTLYFATVFRQSSGPKYRVFAFRILKNEFYVCSIILCERHITRKTLVADLTE